MTLKDIAKDPKWTLVAVDPRLTETAELADIHLRVKPGRDAWLLAALAAVLVQEDRIDHSWIKAHVDGTEDVRAALRAIPVSQYCEIAGVPEALVRETTRRIGDAESVAIFEDLGIQMNRHSTLNSYLNKLLWVLTGNFSKRGAQYVPASIVPITGKLDKLVAGVESNRSPVAGERIISGLTPCNSIPDEILTDHPRRYRAMLVESGNPAHSVADSQRMRDALRSLDTLVVIDIAMTETARLADYILPAATQYEKAEATFFNFEFPENYFHVRRPLFDPPEGVLPEAEIHARLCEALGVYTEADLAPLQAAAAQGRAAFNSVFFGTVLSNPKLAPMAPIILYRTLGPHLPAGLQSSAVVWGLVHQFANANQASLRRAGFHGDGFEPAEKLFDAIVESPSGVIFAVDEQDESWARVKTPNGRIQAAIPELLEELASVGDGRLADATFPFVLSAGERRSFTANTIFRDPEWRKKDAEGSLRINPGDASELGVDTGDRDWLAGTPWHKHVAPRIEVIA